MHSSQQALGREGDMKPRELLALWKDGSTNWISLKDLKESYPVQTTEYAVAAKIAMEPAFAWWVLHILKKRNQII